MTFADAVMDIQQQFSAMFNEAIKTHGFDATMSAVSMFAAAVVHHSEHMVDEANSRDLMLGRWTTHFHAYLVAVQEQCDANNQKPEGMS